MAKPPKEVTRWLATARGGSLEALGQVLEACRGYLLRVASRRLSADLRSRPAPAHGLCLVAKDSREQASYEKTPSAGWFVMAVVAGPRSYSRDNAAVFHDFARAAERRRLFP
jgi:hypothetical protein